jgi:hypothetical protein
MVLQANSFIDNLAASTETMATVFLLSVVGGRQRQKEIATLRVAGPRQERTVASTEYGEFKDHLLAFHFDEENFQYSNIAYCNIVQSEIVYLLCAGR